MKTTITLHGRYTASFLFAVEQRDWEAVAELFYGQVDAFHGKWNGDIRDVESLAAMAASDGVNFMALLETK